MDKREILASLRCLPKLVNGKVVIINDDNTYKLCSVPYTITIADDYNPMNYSILNNKKWTNLVVNSIKSEREDYLVYKQTNKQINKQINKPLYASYRVGDKIHINSRRGIYTLIAINADKSLTITCNKWQYEDNKTHTIPAEDFKCLAGGHYNAAYI